MAGAPPISPRSDALLAAALEAAAVPVALLDPTGRAVWFNRAAEALTGYTREELSGMTMLERVAPEDRADAEALVARLVRGDLPGGEITVRWRRRDGARIPVEWRFSALRGPDGALSHVVALGLDVTERDALVRARAAAEERFRLSFEHAPVGMWLTRADEPHRGAILSVNQAMGRMLGYAEAELVGRAMWDVTHPDDADRERRWVSRWLAHGAEGVFPYEKRFVTAGGDTVWAAVHLSLVAREPGSRVFLSHVLDISDRRIAEQTALTASVDPQTGLLTEAAFLRDLRVVLAEDRPVSVVRLALRAAADVQAVHGLGAVDALVHRAATGLAERLPDDAHLARTGAAEFAALLKATGNESVEIARRRLARPADPSAGAPGDVAVWLAAGVAACEPGQEGEPDALFAAAGAALEDAVRRGAVAALSGRDARERARKRLRWERRVRESLDAAGFVLHGQPVCRLDTREVRFSELSLRLRDEAGKLVSPSVFLPVAESSGLIAEIDRWLLRRALALLEARPRERFAVRISPATLLDRRAGDAAVAILEEHAGAAQRLIVEIAGAEAPLGMRSTVQRIRASGPKILLLNFGLAFGSLHHARTLPLTAIKIHGTLVRDVARGEHDRAVIEAVAALARALGVATIAETVETETLAATLRDAGLDYGQGFLFGRPAPVD